MDFLIDSLAQATPPRTWADTVNDLARTPLSQVVLFIGILTVIRLALFPILTKTLPHKREGLYKVSKVVNELLDALVYAGAFVFLLIRPFAVQTFRIPSGSMWPTLQVYDFIVANKAIYRYTDPKFGDIVVFRPPVEATQDHPEQVDKDGEVNVDFIKRLIGTPGDLIEMKDGKLYRNGEPVEQFTHYSRPTHSEGGVYDQFEALDTNITDHMLKESFKLVKYNGQIIPFNYTDFDGNSIRPRPGPDGMGPYAIASKYAINDPGVQMQLMKAPAERIPKGYYLMMGDNRNNSFDGRGWGLVPRASIIGRSEFVWLPFTRWGVTR